MKYSTTLTLSSYLVFIVCSVEAFSGHDASSIRSRLQMMRLAHHKSDENEGKNENLFERRQVLSQACNLLLLPSIATSIPQVANAAAPVTLKDTDSLAAMAKRKLRAKPPKILRRKLSRDFAVLLMRSSYNALDSLDCVAMDQFQRDFFLIRSSDYETYTQNLGPGLVQQGELTDPYYFDFISYAQYATINREITVNPATVFEEQQPRDQGEDKPMEFVPVVVKRDPSLTDAMLPLEHSRRVGASILDKLDELFQGTSSAIPTIEKGSKPDSARLLASLKKLVNLFLLSGYAFGGDASIAKEGESTLGGSAKGTKFAIRLDAPATLWGGKVLQADGAVLSNSFMTKAATELINRAGYSVSSTIKYEGSSENIVLTIL